MKAIAYLVNFVVKLTVAAAAVVMLLELLDHWSGRSARYPIQEDFDD